MLSLTECQEILNQGHHHYSLEEIDLIRDFLYQLAEVDYAQFIRWI